MFLSTKLLTDAERVEAFSTVPARDRLRQAGTTVGSILKNGGAELIGLGAGPGYVRYGLVAMLDGLRLANRACAQTMESKAAELFIARNEPRTYLDEPEPTDDEAKALLKRALIEMPLQEAATYVDAAMGHLGNAAVRLAVEANCASQAEMTSLGLSGDPAKDKDWLPSPTDIADKLQRAEGMGMAAQLPHFRLVRRWQACFADPDVMWVMKYRQGITHREIPPIGWPSGPARKGSGVRRLRVPLALVDPTALQEVREHLAKALDAIGDLAEVCETFTRTFVPSLRFGLVDHGATVELSSNLPMFRSISVENGTVVVDFNENVNPSAPPGEDRDPGPFIEP